MSVERDALHLRGTILPEDRVSAIFVVNGKVTFEPVDDAKTVLHDGYILPGLVDMHAHLALASPARPEAPPEERVRSPEAALAAGSWSARRFLGLPGIEEGAPADLVAYSEDPRDKLGSMPKPALRILDGRPLAAGEPAAARAASR